MLKAFGVLTLLSIIGKLLGFVREAILAAYFGTSGTADAFFIASIIPVLLFTAIGTAIQAGIIPIYMKDKLISIQMANHKLHILGSFFIWIGLGLSIITFLFAEQLIHLLAPGFSDTQSGQAVVLTRILAPSLLFLTITAIATGIYHANKQFVTPALSPVVQNGIIIVTIVLLANTYGIVGAAVGVVLGAFVQTFVQYPALRKIRFRLHLNLNRNRKIIRVALVLFIPVILAAIVTQLNDVVDRIVTSYLETGSVAAVNYAHRLLWLPLSIMLMPIVTIFYPSLVEKATDHSSAFLTMVKKGVMLIFLLAIPFESVMLLQGENLVEIAYGRGTFEEHSLELTSQAFLFFSLALPFFALRDFFMNALYAINRFRTALYACLIGLVVNAGLSFYLSTFMDIAGVALATSISMVVSVLFLLVKIRPGRINFMLVGKLIVTFMLITIATSYVPALFSNPWLELVFVTILVFVQYGIWLYVWKIPVKKLLRIKA